MKKSGKLPVKQSSNNDKPKRKTRAVIIDKNLCYLCMEYDPDNSAGEDVEGGRQGRRDGEGGRTDGRKERWDIFELGIWNIFC